jgi:hypothetical protein
MREGEGRQCQLLDGTSRDEVHAPSQMQNRRCLGRSCAGGCLSRDGTWRPPPGIDLALASPADSPPHLLREATEPRFGGGVRLEVEVAINCALQAP